MASSRRAIAGSDIFAEHGQDAFRDIEEDDEFRQGVQLYKNPKKKQNRQPDEMSGGTATATEDGDDDDDAPRVDMDELLDDFDELAIEDGQKQKQQEERWECSGYNTDCHPFHLPSCFRPGSSRDRHSSQHHHP